jgi:catechol 2,3-dioxygenase-like lactoylglutathione lyase family enzyme
MPALLEHANITVSDPHKTARWMKKLFGWEIRWEGPGLQTGHTVHVGTKDRYMALFSYGTTQHETGPTHETLAGLNHIAVVVDDVNATESAVKAYGFIPKNHGDYEPGRRFYFHDHDGIEFEVVQYT